MNLLNILVTGYSHMYIVFPPYISRPTILLACNIVSAFSFILIIF
jgi:hypothetical protein